jgi:hypothetical protein
VICLGNHEADLLRLRLRLMTNGIGVDTFYELPSVSFDERNVFPISPIKMIRIVLRRL